MKFIQEDRLTTGASPKQKKEKLILCYSNQNANYIIFILEYIKPYYIYFKKTQYDARILCKK